MDGGTLQSILGVSIFCIGVAFCIFSLKDVHRFVMLLAQRAVERREEQLAAKGTLADSEVDTTEVNKAATTEGDSEDSDDDGKQKWSAFGLVLLTGYRFYTGFLSATWLPYLLALEGQDLFTEKQALFMGLAKLIYGGTIVLNPVFGLVGDQATALSHGVGRRLFVRVGITMAGLGIYICSLADRTGSFMCSLSGIMLWRFGEAINDVTTEAIVPEMVSQDQYQLASGIKASSFLFGGLGGYTLILIFADYHYTWLYYAYPISMFICAVPGLILLDSDKPFAPTQRKEMQRRRRNGVEEESSEGFWQSLVKAYVSPMRYKGGFPRACLAVFIFGLGTTPMFFLLLIVRDLVGITDAVQQQKRFSVGSIIFFIASALAAISISQIVGKPDRSRAPQGGRRPPPQEEQQIQQPERDPQQPLTLERQVSEGTARAWANAEMLARRGWFLVVATICFGITVLLIPCIALFQEPESRDRAFYLCTVVFGGTFGVAFSLFQDLTWELLPPDVDFANAMGFNVMSRLLGIGLGNFACGLMLDMCLDKTSMEIVTYKTEGYVMMCVFSGCCVLLAAATAKSALTLAQRVDLEERSSNAAVRAA